MTDLQRILKRIIVLQCRIAESIERSDINLGYVSMTAFGKTEAEAQERLRDEFFCYQSELVKALSHLQEEITDF